MPLVWERAFGGPGTDNPVGCGMDRAGALPNLESISQPMLAFGDRPPPTCPGPLSPSWSVRQRHAGTYDRRWAEEHFPRLARDFDVRFSMASTQSQWRPQFFQAGERIELTGLHPVAWNVRTRIPDGAPLVHVDRDEASNAVGMVLDTAIIDADAGQITFLWRGLTPVADNDASDVRRVRVTRQDSAEVAAVDATAPLAAPRTAGRATDDRAVQPEPSAPEPSAPEPSAPDHTPQPNEAPATQVALDAPAPAPRNTLPGLGADVDAANVDMESVESAPAAATPDVPHHAGRDALEQTVNRELAKAYALMAELGLHLPTAAPTPAPDMEAIRRMVGASGLLDPAQTDAFFAEVDARSQAAAPEPRAAVAPALTTPPPSPQDRFVAAHAASASVHELLSDEERETLSLEGLPLRGLNARGADLRGVCFDDCDLCDSDFRGALLEGASFENARLERVRFDGADLDAANLRGASLREACLDDATLEGAHLEQVDAARATLLRTDLTSACLRGARFASALLDEAVLRDADLSEADFSDARLVQARFHGATAPRAVFRRANLEGCRVADGACFDEADLRDTQAEGARLRGASFVRARFDRSVLRRADLSGSDLSGACLAATDLRNGRFVETRLRGVVLERSDLMNAVLQGADLSHADLREANLYGADLYGAEMASTVMPTGSVRS